MCKKFVYILQYNIVISWEVSLLCLSNSVSTISFREVNPYLQIFEK